MLGVVVMGKVKQETILDVDLKDGDYTLVDGTAWFTIKKFSVRVYATDEGIVADIWIAGKENEDVIASTYAFDHECEED